MNSGVQVWTRARPPPQVPTPARAKFAAGKMRRKASL
jgi:hypothetical protein